MLVETPRRLMGLSAIEAAGARSKAAAIGSIPIAV
jgi:hypothetical protein